LASGRVRRTLIGLTSIIKNKKTDLREMIFSLPYYRESDQLPGPLPEQHEIDHAVRSLPTIRNPDYGGRLVVIRDLYVVKYGPYVAENEGYALLFIEQKLSIPAPRLYAMYRNEDKLYIVMQYIPGITLGHIWPSLPENTKTVLLGELRSIFADMRSLPSPGFYGSVTQGPVPHRYFFSREGNPAITGPFTKEEDFSKAIALRSRQIWSDRGRHGWTSDFLARHLPSALSGHQPTFTHGDLYRENILVKKVKNSTSGVEEYRIAAIIDWETAGWYPSYWEYGYIFPLFQWDDDWPESVESILDPWPLEAALLRFVQEDLEF
jgi:aminoglycoside phosphotransferase (APT) family kinase protein